MFLRNVSLSQLHDFTIRNMYRIFKKFRLSEITALFISLILCFFQGNHHAYLATLATKLEAIRKIGLTRFFSFCVYLCYFLY
jgi:hypothetical protein